MPKNIYIYIFIYECDHIIHFRRLSVTTVNSYLWVVFVNTVHKQRTFNAQYRARH